MKAKVQKKETGRNGRLSLIGVRFPAEIGEVVREMAEDEDRPLSAMVVRLVKTHPRVEQFVATKTALGT